MVDVCIYSDKWIERVVKINISEENEYRISWRGTGKQYTVGGLIDYLRFCSGSCP